MIKISLLVSLLVSLLAIPFSFSAHASQAELFGELFGRPSRPGVKAFYELEQYGKADQRLAMESLQLRKHHLDFRVPLNRLSDKRWQFFQETKLEQTETNARFANGTGVPRNLWQAHFGLTHIRELEEGNTFAGSFSIGSASNALFSQLKDTIVQSTLIYKTPTSDDAGWVYLLNFSTGRSFLNYYPLPGIAYYFRPADSLRLTVGLPFFLLFWTPFEKTVVNLTYFPLMSGQFKFSYFLFGPAHIYAQTKTNSENYLLKDRPSSKDRLFREEINSTVGINMPLERNILADLHGGYSWERKYFIAHRTRAEKDVSVLRYENAFYAGLKLTAVF